MNFTIVINEQHTSQEKRIQKENGDHNHLPERPRFDRSMGDPFPDYQQIRDARTENTTVKRDRFRNGEAERGVRNVEYFKTSLFVLQQKNIHRHSVSQTFIKIIIIIFLLYRMRNFLGIFEARLSVLF